MMKTATRTGNILAAVVLASGAVCAAEYSIPAGATGADIQAGIDAAPEGAIITLAPGEYAVTAPISITKRITLRGVDADRGAVLLNGQGMTSVLSATAPGVTIQSLTVTNGFLNTLNGTAGVSLNGGVLTNCVVAGCKAIRDTFDDATKASLLVAGASVTSGGLVADCDFVSNIITNGRGAAALYIENGLAVNNCNFVSNVFECVGTAFNDNFGVIGLKATPMAGCSIIGNRVFSGNDALCAAGLTVIGDASVPVITNCLIACNYAAVDHLSTAVSGLMIRKGKALAVDCVISNNVCPEKTIDYTGSSVFITDCGPDHVAMSQCKIIGNECGASRGESAPGLICERGGIVDSCVFSGNKGKNCGAVNLRTGFC